MAKFLTNIDLRQNQLKNAVIEQLAAAPASAKAGQVYFNTTTKKFCVCVDSDAQTWESFATVDALASAVSTLEGAIALKADKTALEQAITDLEGKIDAKDHLPAQADNAGKVLTTDGTDASWDYVIKMNNVTEGTESGLSKLVINKLTKAEYDALETAGQIKDTELYITDAEAYTKEEVDASVEGINDALALKADKTELASEIQRVEGVVATKADQSALTTAVSTLEGQIATKADSSTLESEIQRVEGVVATKADKTTVESEIQRVDGAIALKADQTALEGAVQTLEGKIDEKATKATTLAGYGITDAYTQEQINDALALKADKADTYTKAEVDAKVSSVYKFKGSVATVEDLPTEGNVEGDVYNVQATGENYAWVAATETVEGHWDDLGGDIDLTPYLTKDEASTTYLTQTNAASTYLTQTNAESTYLTQTDASSTYATKDELTQVSQGSVHKISAQNTELVPADGVATWTVAHTLGTDVDVVIKEVATNEVVYADVVMNSNEVVIKINSDSTIAADTYKAIILG